ncbi:MAG TPA: type II toxin-antitoxin system VapC family toxin [Candidatus Dormibacteraeota bacterium]|nr:type II toxin-antitoxin system VapC family toxin [Candidatus Dormibacteraeota bacterium]
MDCVVDASAAVAWSLRDEASSLSEVLLDALETGEGFVPPIWPLEVANALLMAERRRRIAPGGARRLLAELSTLTIEIDYPGGPDQLDDEIALAHKHGLTAYDAAYLALALRLTLPLATIDTRLRAAATEAGVALVTN